MLEVKKSGSTQFGVWIIGTLKLNGIEINSIFNTNLDKVPAEKNLKVNKVKISNTKDGKIRYSLEF